MKGLLIFLISFLSIKTLSDSGSFKLIDPHYDGNCMQVNGVSGPEDITVHDNGLALISSDNRRLTLKGTPIQGHIFSYNLNNESAQIEKLTDDIDFEFHPHGISVYENFDKVVLFVVNHRKNKNTIEVFHLINNKLFFKKTIYDDLLNSPNDIVAINENEFYLTNDHGHSTAFGKMIEDYLQLSKSNVLYYDGKKFKVVIDKLQYANGINFNKSKTELFVAETIGKNISIYNRNAITNDFAEVHMNDNGIPSQSSCNSQRPRSLYANNINMIGGNLKIEVLTRPPQRDIYTIMDFFLILATNLLKIH